MTDIKEPTREQLEQLQRDAGIPHLPTVETYWHRKAMSGEGPHAFEWTDKPHRLVFDLCRIIEASAASPPSPAPAESGAVAFDIDRFLQDDSKLPVTSPAPSASMGRVTDAMVQRAEIAVYGLHERGFIMRPLIDPIDMRAALEAALDCGVDGWQSIETAPKNRKMLVAYRNRLGNWRIVIACYHTRLPWSEDDDWNSESEFAPEAWYEESDSQDSILPTASAPTHWQPLPAPPALPTQASEDGR